MNTREQLYLELNHEQSRTQKVINHLLHCFFIPEEYSELNDENLKAAHFSAKDLIIPPTCYDPFYPGVDTLVEIQAMVDQSLKQCGFLSHSGISIAYNRLGNVYHRLGTTQNDVDSLQKALHYHRYALKSDLVFAGKQPLQFYYASVTCNFLGMVCCELGYLDHALKYHLSAIKIKTAFFKRYQVKDIYIADSYCNLATVCFHLKKYNRAQTYYHKALKVAKDYFGKKPSEFLAKIYDNLACVYQSRGYIELAIACVKKEITVYQQLNDLTNIRDGIEYLNSLSKLQFKNKQSESERVTDQHPTIGLPQPEVESKPPMVPKKYSIRGESERVTDLHPTIGLPQPEVESKSPIVPDKYTVRGIFCSTQLQRSVPTVRSELKASISASTDTANSQKR